MMNKTLKLNLGCGYDHREGWINVDIDPKTKPDLIHDVTKPFPYKDHCISEILAQDVLEHITLEQAHPFLEECHRVLKSDGILTVRVPNVYAIMKKFGKQPDIMMHFLYGNTEKNGVWGAHKYGYTPALMRSIAWRHRLRISRTTPVDTNWEFELKPSTRPPEFKTVGELPIPISKLKKILPWKTGTICISGNPIQLLIQKHLLKADSLTVWLLGKQTNILLLKLLKTFLWELDLVVVQNQQDKQKVQKKLHISHLKVVTLKH